ncbi:MAG TPA: putative porin [Lacunisphaera sp.]|nr:putative porin [Lacunisphaera sp.]
MTPNTPDRVFQSFLIRRLLPIATLAAAGLFLLPASRGDIVPFSSEPNLSVYGDLRLRQEWDWDSRTSTGAPRTDRDRARIRARLGFGYKLADGWSFGARARTGNRLSQQSPHLTYSSNDRLTDNFGVQLDKYFLQYKQGPLTAWGGRNGPPFWQQDEMVLDEDVTPTGIGGTYDTKLDEGNLTTAAGAFYMPDGAVYLNGTLVGGQLKYSQSVKPAQVTVAASLYSFNGKNGARNLRNRNGARDYLIGVLSAQWSEPLGGRSLVVGGDLIRNFENYSAADVAPFAAKQADQTDGYVGFLLWGQLKDARDWQLGYYYAHIETLAVNASYSQDDWARFGSATQADVTDFKGHEFRATYLLTKNINVQARLFLVKAITSIQDGKRLRIDFNWKF